MSEAFVDPVVAEIHATRAAMLKATGGDIAELMRQVADRQQRSDRRIIREPLRKREEPPHGSELKSLSGRVEMEDNWRQLEALEPRPADIDPD